MSSLERDQCLSFFVQTRGRLFFLQHFILINPSQGKFLLVTLVTSTSPIKKKARHLLTTLPRGGSASWSPIARYFGDCALPAEPDLTNWRGRLPYCDGIRGLPFFITEVAALAGLDGLV